MGCEANITHSKFPKQSNWLGRTVEVFFHYDSSRKIKGTVVRDDLEEPFRMIIHLSDGRMVLATECQYVPLDDRSRS